MTPPDPAVEPIPAPKEFTFSVSAPFAAALQAAVEMYGEPVVKWAWDAFMPPFLVFAKELHKEQRLTAMAASLSLDAQQTDDAFKLLACLKGATDPHKAWLAAEILLRSTPVEALDNLTAAMAQPQPGKPS